MICFEGTRIAKVMLNEQDITQFFLDDNYDYIPYIFRWPRELAIGWADNNEYMVLVESNFDWTAHVE